MNADEAAALIAKNIEGVTPESQDSSAVIAEFEGRANAAALMVIRCALCQRECWATTQHGETVFGCSNHGWMATAKAK